MNSSSRGDGFNVIVDVEGSSERDSLGERTTSTSSFTNYQERKKQINMYRCVRKICGITIVSAVVILFILLIYVSARGDENGQLNENLAARLPFHQHRTMEERCNATTYGCCEVYNSCNLHEDGNFTYTQERIWPSVEVKHNKGGTNCPRMNHMVREYNLHYYPWDSGDNFNCRNSTYGCCSIDISCDVFVYVMIDISHNTNYSYYKSSSPIERWINHAKENEMGTNCPTFNRVVLEYNNGFYDPINDLAVLLILIALLFSLITCIKNKGG